MIGTFRFTKFGPSIAGVGIEHGWKIGTCKPYTPKTKMKGWKTIRSFRGMLTFARLFKLWGRFSTGKSAGRSFPRSIGLVA